MVGAWYQWIGCTYPLWHSWEVSDANVLHLYSDTVGRSGMFCAIVTTIERCKTEGVVDVFQVVKALRVQKPGAVLTAVGFQRQLYRKQTLFFFQMQYRAIFNVVAAYLESFSNYANFWEHCTKTVTEWLPMLIIAVHYVVSVLIKYQVIIINFKTVHSDGMLAHGLIVIQWRKSASRVENMP